MSRPVLVGMNNPLSSDPRMALYPAPVNCTGWRVWQMLLDAGRASYSHRLEGHPLPTGRDYAAAFERRNVLSATEWSRKEALASGLSLMDELSGRTIVVLGIRTAEALRLPRLPWCEWGTHYHLPETTTYCIVPHPSGRCREYNDPEMRERVGSILWGLYRGVQPAVAPSPAPRLL